MAPSVLHERLPVAPWIAEHALRLPGTKPIDPADWLQRDETFPAQMALRDSLIADRATEVHALLPGAEDAAAETLETVLAHLHEAAGYARTTGDVIRPDGVCVSLAGPPLATAGRLVQEDLCLMQKPKDADEHLLAGAVLCFPSNWTLAQKLGMGLARIHRPVERYDANLALRVQRMLDVLRPETPLMRANLLISRRPELFSPLSEFVRHQPAPGEGRFVRVERQTLLRLPRTRAIVFSIHTYVLAFDALTAEQRARLAGIRPDAFTSASRAAAS